MGGKANTGLGGIGAGNIDVDKLFKEFIKGSREKGLKEQKSSFVMKKK